MNKKCYRAPQLKTRKVELGVFGNYPKPGPGTQGNTNPYPVEVVRDLRLHMD